MCEILLIQSQSIDNRLSRDHTFYIVILASKVVKERCRFKCRNGSLLILQCICSYKEGRYDRIARDFVPHRLKSKN